MDIFNRKRIEELEEKLYDTERERDKYVAEATILEAKLREIGRLEDTIPADCEKGSWCKACEFARTLHYTERYGRYGGTSLETLYVCNKGNSCQNFVQRKVEE